MSNPAIKKRLQFHFNNMSNSNKNKLVVSPPMGYDVAFKLVRKETHFYFISPSTMSTNKH